MTQHKIDLPREVTVPSLIGYARFFQLENWLRELVYLETKAHFGRDWWAEAELALKRSGAPGIPADKSINRDKIHRHMATPENDPLWFLSLDGLIKIIFDDQLWPLFECYLTTKDLLKAKFTEITPIRNRVAHNRLLHEDDLDRVRRFLRDLDHGFWEFCSSFNDHRPFIGHDRQDLIYHHFQDRIGVDYVEVEPNTWTLVGSTIGMHQNLSVEYSVRPSRPSNALSNEGKIYHFTYSIPGSNQRAFDYAQILEETEQFHAAAIYIIMDSFQSTLDMSIPALYAPDEIIEVAEKFYRACSSNQKSRPHESIKKNVGASLGEAEYEYAVRNRPFEQLAAQWPHYVIPPAHAFAVLAPDTPCSFFEA